MLADRSFESSSRTSDDNSASSEVQPTYEVLRIQKSMEHQIEIEQLDLVKGIKGKYQTAGSAEKGGAASRLLKIINLTVIVILLCLVSLLIAEWVNQL